MQKTHSKFEDSESSFSCLLTTYEGKKRFLFFLTVIAWITSDALIILLCLVFFLDRPRFLLDGPRNAHENVRLGDRRGDPASRCTGCEQPRTA